MTNSEKKIQEGELLTVAFQTRGVINTEAGLEPAYQNAMEVVLTFAESTVNRKLPVAARKGGGFLRHGAGYTSEAIHLPDRHLWAFQMEVYALGRFDVAIIERQGVLHIAGMVHHKITADYPAAEILGFAQMLAKISVHETPSPGHPVNVEDDAGVNKLYELLCAPERKYPIIVASEIRLHQWKSPYQTPHFMIDTRAMGIDLCGIATVVSMTARASMAWSNLIGKSWAVYDGAVRTYYPGFAVDDAFSKHPIMFQDSILKFERNELKGPSGFQQFLKSMIRRFAKSVHFDFCGIFFLSDAKILCEEVSIISKEHFFPVPMIQDHEDNAVQSLTEELRRKSEEAMNYRRELINLKAELTRQRRKTQEVKEKCVRVAAVDKSGKSAYPDSFDKIADWTKHELAGKILLHPRAERGLSKAQYESPELVCQALLLLGNEYRNARLGTSSDYKFKKRCRELGLLCKGSIDKSRAGEEGGQYFVNYPCGSDQQQFLKMKICKGTSYHRRYCLRIYFFWDSASELVVVGSLPHHLSNRAS